MQTDTTTGKSLELLSLFRRGAVWSCMPKPKQAKPCGYGTTACKWDTCIPFEPLWEQYHRLVKPSGAIVLFGSEPFSTALRHSNLKEFRYDWIWEKEQGANFMLCKYQPYKVHEIISVFSRERHLYHPQMTAGKPYISGKGTSGDVTGNVKKKQTVNTGTRYPRSILRFNTDKGRGGATPNTKTRCPA